MYHWQISRAISKLFSDVNVYFNTIIAKSQLLVKNQFIPGKYTTFKIPDWVHPPDSKSILIRPYGPCKINH